MRAQTKISSSHSDFTNYMIYQLTLCVVPLFKVVFKLKVVEMLGVGSKQCETISPVKI